MEKISAAVAWRLADRLRGGGDTKQQQSGIAEFVRMDSDGTAWIRIPGNNFDTPVDGGVFVDAKDGDTVTYTISGGQVSVSGNATSPAVGGTYVAEKVRPVERKAMQAKTAADVATEEASRAHDAADAAQSSANSAAAAAAVADEKAVAAGNAAAAAQSSANSANTYANAALDQLGIVQDVIGVLTWATEHGSFTLTSDTTIVEGKVYFTYDSQTGDYTPVIDPQASALSTYYELSVDEAMEAYIMAHLAVTSRGLWVLPSGIGSGTTPASGESQQDSDARQGSGYKTLLASDGSYVYDGTGVLVARYGSVTEFYAGGKSMVEIGSSGARIGATDTSHVEIDYHSLQLVDMNSNAYLYVSDARDTTGYATITETFVGDGTTRSFEVQLPPVGGSATATVDGVTTDVSVFYGEGSDVPAHVSFAAAPSQNAVIEVVYSTTSIAAKAYTLGIRHESSRTGYMSLATGLKVNASGHASHAEGMYTNATGGRSHAEGQQTSATGSASHAEGLSTRARGSSAHAEGYLTTASGMDSHAEGYRSVASGQYSHAQNCWTETAHFAQTAIGKFNDNDANNAFEIGNGTDYDYRSNAFTVDWSGNVTSDGGLLKLDNAQRETRTYLQAVEESALNRTRLGTHRSVNGTDVYNNLNLIIDDSGNRSVAVSEVAPWLDMLGITPSDTTATVGSAAASIGTNSVRRSGKVVTVTLASIQLASAISNGSYSGTIATIPAGYRPASNAYGACYAAGANLGGSYARITTEGVVAIRNQSGSSIAASTTVLSALSITYIIA